MGRSKVELFEQIRKAYDREKLSERRRDRAPGGVNVVEYR
jgi:hypothetical protein